GYFTNVQLASNLLIEQPVHNQGHHLALTRRERRVTVSQRLYFRFLAHRVAALLDRMTDRVQQNIGIEWLGEGLDRACFHGPYGHRDVALPGDEDDGQGSTLCEPLLQFKAVKPRQR